MKTREDKAQLGRPREFDAEQALDRAMRVFWAKGYLGASLTDLTTAMGISRPSLYAAFGNKAALFRKALEHYGRGPAGFVSEAVAAPTAREVVERIWRGVVATSTGCRGSPGCMWVRGTLSCGNGRDPLGKELAAMGGQQQQMLRRRFERAIKEGDLPADSDAGDLARLVRTVSFGLAVQAAAGAKRGELERAVTLALRAWPG